MVLGKVAGEEKDVFLEVKCEVSSVLPQKDSDSRLPYTKTDHLTAPCGDGGIESPRMNVNVPRKSTSDLKPFFTGFSLF